MDRSQLLRVVRASGSFLVERTDLECGHANPRMLGHQFGCLIEIISLEQENAAYLLFGFSVRAISDGRFTVSVAQGFGVRRTLQRLQANEVTIFSQHIVISETFLDEGLTL